MVSVTERVSRFSPESVGLLADVRREELREEIGMSAAWAKKRYAVARVEVISWSRTDDARSRMVGAGSQLSHLV